MDFIQNADLREWVRKNLKRKLFQKAHELAIQTGCEVLLRVQDHGTTEAQGTQYYATNTIQRTYENNRVHKRPGEVLVSGATGLPAVTRIDRGIQMMASEGYDAGDLFPSEDGDDGDDDNNDGDFIMRDPFTENTPGRADIGTSTSTPVKSANSGTNNNNDDGNHVLEDSGQKIDLTQDSDSDDSIVEVEEVKQEPSNRNGGADFKREPMYEDNVYTHPTPYQCGVCKKAFANLQVLESHNQTEHMQRSVGGNSTAGVVPNVQHQQEAMLSFKLEPNSYTCIRCQTTFNDSTVLRNHMTQCHMSTTASTRGVVQSNQSTPHFTNASSVTPTKQHSPGKSSPLPQITSVTSLKFMPGGMTMASSSPMPPSSPMSTTSPMPPSSPMQSLSPMPSSPMFQSPGTSGRGSLSSTSPGRPPSSHGASPRVCGDLVREFSRASGDHAIVKVGSIPQVTLI